LLDPPPSACIFTYIFAGHICDWPGGEGLAARLFVLVHHHLATIITQVHLIRNTDSVPRVEEMVYASCASMLTTASQHHLPSPNNSSANVAVVMPDSIAHYTKGKTDIN